MPIFYIDPVNGDDNTTATPLGWWSVAYTGGSGTAPQAGETVTGATSGSTAKLTVAISPASGSWESGTAAGIMYFYGKSDAFTSEQVNCAGGGHFHITSDFTNCAWKTGTSGALATRTAPGDTMRVHKSPPPVSIGDAIWTDNSNFVTIAAGLCEAIDDCDSNWTNDHGIMARIGYSSESGVFQGSYCMKCTADATPSAGERQIWKNIPDKDLSSGYQFLNFWLTVPLGGVIADKNWKICLYDDDLATNIVDTFEIPAISGTGQYTVPMKLQRVGEGNISSNIKAIGIHVGSIPPAGGSVIKVDAFFVSKTDGIDLNVLISKNGNDQGGSDEWYSIASCMGTTLQLRGMGRIDLWRKYGTDGISPETVETFIRQPHPTYASGSGASDYNCNEAGTDGNMISYEGGFNSANNEQDGESFFSGNVLNKNISPTQIFNTNNKKYIRVTHFHGFMGTSYIFLVGNQSSFCQIEHCGAGGAVTWGFNISANYTTAQIDYITMCGYGVLVSGSYSYLHIYKGIGNQYGVIHSQNTPVYKWIIRLDLAARNAIGSINLSAMTDCEILYLKSWYNAYTVALGNDRGSQNFIKKLDCNEASFSQYFGAHNADPIIRIGELVGGNPTILMESANIVKQVASVGGTGFEWKVNITGADRTVSYAAKLIVARIMCVADLDMTIKVFFKKNHATYVGARLFCRGGQIAGVDDDVVVVCPDDTNRNELSLTIHPTEIGCVEIYAHVYYVAGLGSVIIDGTIDVTQS